jgi:hypothetical protein
MCRQILTPPKIEMLTVAFSIICLIAVLYYVGKHRDILPVDFSSKKDPKTIKVLSIFCAFLVLHGVVLSFFQFPK